MLYRTPDLGGLGLYNVKSICLAMLIHTFLLQAVCPSFPTNYYLNFLFRWHVLGEQLVEDPGRPPYYTQQFFSIIKDVHENTPLNLAWITVKQWYKILLEKGVTHNTDDQDSPPITISSKLEVLYPEKDFVHSYHMSRKFGLSPEQKSFLFKMLQNLLPTKERLHFIVCPNSTEVTNPLLTCLSSQDDNVTPQDVVYLNILTPESWQFPAAWLIATCLSLAWENSTRKKYQSNQSQIRIIGANSYP